MLLHELRSIPPYFLLVSGSASQILRSKFQKCAEPIMEDIKLFHKYSFADVEVHDETLKPYINVHKPGIVPHTSSRETLGRFGKAHTPIVERFVVHMMGNGRNTGKKRLAIRIFKTACEIMERITKENPIQLLINAIENSGPRESSSRVGRGGSMKRTSVDVSPYRRLNIALRLLSHVIREASFKNNNKTISEIMANEIINAARGNQNSAAVKKREEIERIAKSNR